MNETKMLVEITDELCNANKMLEVCRGYTQAEEVDVKALEVILFNLVMTYEKIYEKICRRN